MKFKCKSKHLAVIKFYVGLSICAFTFSISYALQWEGDDLLLFSTEREIGIFNSSRVVPNKNRIIHVAKNQSHTSGVAFHYEKRVICWSDVYAETIECVHYNKIEQQTKLATTPFSTISGVLSAEGLACDWITSKLYWTDNESRKIEVATITGEFRKVLFWTNLDLPRSIEVIPDKGLMVWTDWGEFPKIEVAGMNGDAQTRKKIVTKDIFWPNGLTVDYKMEKIYWIDAKLLFIDSINYDGRNRTRLLTDAFKYPHSLTHFKSRFYYTDWSTWKIHGFDLSLGKVSNNSFIKDLEHFDVSFPVDVDVFNAESQPKYESPCTKDNGGCSHLCLLAPYAPGYTCACPIGIKNVTSLSCADKPQEMLLVAGRDYVNLVYLDSPEFTYKLLPINNLNFTIGVDYDPVENYLYLTDSLPKKIVRAKLDGSETLDVISTEESPDGIALDLISRNIYWVDSDSCRIEVARLDFSYRKVVVSEDLDKPRSVAVASELGWMFWTDWGKNPKIERSNLDGSDRLIIVSENIEWPNGIALDLERLKIYWSDGKRDKIEYANFDGKERRDLVTVDVPHVFGLSLIGDWLYWTDWQRRSVERVHKETGGNRLVIASPLPNIMGLKAFNLEPPQGQNECGKNNGNCSQLCLPRHNRERLCACTVEYELAADGVTCVLPKSYLLYASDARLGRIGLENKDNEKIIPIAGKESASAMDFESNTMSFYWSDVKTKSIMRCFTNGSYAHKVIDIGLISPSGLAIDWVGLNVYWTDSAANKIEVARVVGTGRRNLICDNIFEPHNIVLNMFEGYMYWAEWDQFNSIKKAQMDGKAQRRLLGSEGRAITLALDSKSKRLFWTTTDVSTYSIMSSDLDGNDRTMILKDPKYKPLGLSIYNTNIVWSEKYSGEIYLANIDGNNKRKHYTLDSNVTSILTVSSKKYPEANQCAVSNGGCSHLCLTLPSANGGEATNFTCACPTHYVLQDKNCVSPKQFMIYSQKNLAVRLIFDTSECPEAVLPIQMKTIRAIDYDPIQDYLYWIENKTHHIKRAEAIGQSVPKLFIGGNQVMRYDLVVDPLGRILFWTSKNQNAINVTRLDNNISFGVISRKDEAPRLLAIHITKRFLFYTDDAPSGHQLIRTRLDGSHKIVIVKTSSEIAAIAVDMENDLIVWVQGQNIHISNIDGENQHVVLHESNSKITHLTVHLGYLYWVDRELHQIQRMQLISGKSRSTVLSQASQITDLISVNKVDTTHPCWHQLKKCSHFCIMNGTSALCACPDDMRLDEDGKTCVPVKHCEKDYFTCSVSHSDGRECIPNAWRCDSQPDCKDGSDELGCCEHGSDALGCCDSKQYHCSNGQCLDNATECDGVPQCSDGSDESKCCPNGFRCHSTQTCLPQHFVCDGVENCPDAEDESNCPTSKTYITIIVVLVVVIVLVLLPFVTYLMCKKNNSSSMDHCADQLSPLRENSQVKMQKLGKGIPDVVRMSMLNGGSNTSTYDRNNITGASSSTNESSACYPRETLNPPPSPATTAASTARGNSPTSRYRPYRHYRSINQPPPPTPCSTDVCDESDYNYPTSRNHRYDAGPFPPPPTPRSRHSESCPPSPSSRSSTYFSPLPPPPSPVASPRSYDS